MPIDLPPSMTLNEHLIELCDRVGIASRAGDAADLPDSAPHLDKAKRFWNAGYRKFLLADPKWTFLHRDHTITMVPAGTGPDNINSSPFRYRLPAWAAGNPNGNWTFTDDMAEREFASVCDRQHVEQLHQRSQTTLTGTPMYAGHYTIDGDNGVEDEATVHAVVFFPSPSNAYVAQATFRMTGHRLRDLGERHAAGGDHDETILAFALFEWALSDESLASRLAGWKLDRDERLAASIRLDQTKRVRNLGGLPVAGVSARSLSPRTRIVTVNGVQVSP